jgi:hypothetical protein
MAEQNRALAAENARLKSVLASIADLVEQSQGEAVIPSRHLT